MYEPLTDKTQFIPNFHAFYNFPVQNKLADSFVFQASIPGGITLLECRVYIKAFADINNIIKYTTYCIIQICIYYNI
jgi:hypothetical protein